MGIIIIIFTYLLLCHMAAQHIYIKTIL